MPGDDRISKLPDNLITQILSYLPTKVSVRTSVLSTKWKNLWLNVPRLDLDCDNFSFVDRFFEFNPELRLQKLMVTCRGVQADRIKDRISTVVSRGVQHLAVEGHIYYTDGNVRKYPRVDYIPLNLYTSKTLVSLKLSYLGLQDPGFVSMPCLKSMHLVKIMWIGTMDMEKLISGCPVLEELTLLPDLFGNLRVKCVKSQIMKRFCIPLETRCLFNLREVFKILEIDAPALEYMSIKEDISERCVVKNLSSLLMIDLGFKFLASENKLFFFDPEDVSKRNEIRDFLTGISSVRHMILSQKTVKALALYSKGGLVPKFDNLSRLQAVFPCVLLQFLPALLESCPNLKHLILKVVDTQGKGMNVLKPIDVPQCFLSTLECVEIKGLVKWEKEEMKLASLFLEKSAVLKKLIVSFADYPPSVPDSEIYEELYQLPKCCQRCQIIIDY